MYNFKKLIIENLEEKRSGAGFFDMSCEEEKKEILIKVLNGFNGVKAIGEDVLREIIELGQKYKHQLFDDFVCPDECKTASIVDFAVVLRIFEIIYQSNGNFWIIEAENGNFAGFTYIYDLISVNYPTKIIDGEDEKIEYISKLHTATLAGCLKRDFWGSESKKIAKQLITMLFEECKIQKIKCETFKRNPYIGGLLRTLGFRKEGTLIAETLSRGEPEDIDMWAISKKEFATH